MKNKIIFVICVLISTISYCQSPYFWYKGDVQQLSVVENRMYIMVRSAADTNAVKSSIISRGYSIEPFRKSLGQQYNNPQCEYWTNIASENDVTLLPSDTLIRYHSYWYSDNSGKKIGISDLFSVKLHTLEDTVVLKDYANIMNVSIVEHDQFMPLWFTLACYNNSTGDALEMANLFHESGLFAASEPDFIAGNKALCTNDPNFAKQWGLKNTGQNNGVSGIDIKYCEASQITQGNPDIYIALIDLGLEPIHPDMPNFYPISYDTESETSPSVLWGYHGIWCAGIFGALTNNTIGMASIAPLCTIMPISNTLDSTRANVIKLAKGINFAWKNGASVISNSWESSVSTRLTEAIDSAVIKGRGGKGSVLVFASGNNSSSQVTYPASLPNVIAVGGVDRCGVRSGRRDIIPVSCDPWPSTWDKGSSYGERLSVVAPGTNVFTIDRLGQWGATDYNYYPNFGGTSAAAPHVSGIAALMLSVNPNLTAKQVRNIIEKTAQKVRPDLYHYTDTLGHPNGKWNKKTGYGLVDAYDAVKVALGYDLYTRDNNQDVGGPFNTNTFIHDSPDIWLRRTADGGAEHQMAYNGTNYVYVKVHNRGPAPSMPTDSIRLYFRRAELQNSNNWYSNTWYYGGVAALPEIPVGDSVTVKIPVNISTYLQFDNFAFYTRIDSQYDTLRVPETSSTSNNIDFNNNISAKNTKITSLLIAEDNSGLDANFAVAHEPNFVSTSNLRINLSEDGPNILNEAEVTIIFPEDMMSEWIPESDNLKQVTANTYLVTGETVELTDVPETDVTLRYNFLTRRNEPNEIYKNHVTQYVGSGDDEEIIGGLTIQIEKPECAAADRFRANAGNDTAIMLNTTATLHATKISENATYRWYDKQRNFEYEGLNYTVATSKTSEYILEVTAESDGYRDLDTVKVTVLPGYINSITPNPVTDDWVTVSYEYATTVTSAQLFIYNNGTATLVGNYDLSDIGNVSSLDIDITTFPTGSYTVVMVCDNAVCHSKMLIRQ